jgi:hypothetical protein
MLVFIIAAQFNLTDPVEGTVPEDFSEHSYLEPPIGRNTVDSGKVCNHRELARQRITERSIVLE